MTYGNNPALLSSSSYQQHSINNKTITTTQNKNKDKNKNKKNPSLLLQFKIILTLVSVFSCAVLSTFIQVIPSIIVGNNPGQLSTSILKTTPTTPTLRTAAATTTSTINIPINDESDWTAQDDIDINSNHDNSNNRNDPSIYTNPIQNKTKTKFDPTQITTVYHLGHKRRYGRSNNQIITILHAIDIALDNNSDNTDEVVVAISNWAFKILKGIFFNGSNETKFAVQLEQIPTVVLLVHEDRLDALNLSASTNSTIQHIYLDTQHTYFYIQKNRHRISAKTIEKRRRLVLGQLFQQIGIADRNLVLYNIVQNYININSTQINNSSNSKISSINSSNSSNSKISSINSSNSNSSSSINTKYITIHSRWLEGECERRIGDLLPAKDECWMTPSYIKDIILSASGGDLPIVFISDGQNKDVLTNLKNDPDIGKSIIVPRDIIEQTSSTISTNNNQKSKSYDDLVLWWTQPWNDMMVAIHSDIFIGTRSSSFATIVGISRIAIGKDPKTNYIYTEQLDRQHQRQLPNSTSDNDNNNNNSIIGSVVDGQQQQENKERSMIIDICEECLFLCNNSQSHLCGHEVIYS
jgi:hypothetical protein